MTTDRPPRYCIFQLLSSNPTGLSSFIGKTFRIAILFFRRCLVSYSPPQEPRNQGHSESSGYSAKYRGARHPQVSPPRCSIRLTPALDNSTLRSIVEGPINFGAGIIKIVNQQIKQASTMQTLEVKGFRPNKVRRRMTIYESIVTRLFTKLFYDCWRRGQKRGTSPSTLSLHWFGHELLKCPLDLWTYQEILCEHRPEFIIETGTYRGGSALYLATLLDALGNGKIITVDPHQYEHRPSHPRIEYLQGSSTDTKIVDRVRSTVNNMPCLVILDSDHSYEHVLNELRLYREFVQPGDYIIVEDSIVNGHPAFPKHGPGPMEAIKEFLKEDQRFQSDSTRERFLLTMNPRGFLKRIA